MTTNSMLEQSKGCDELTSDEMANVYGGNLFESACKGTHIPEVTIELW